MQPTGSDVSVSTARSFLSRRIPIWAMMCRNFLYDVHHHRCNLNGMSVEQATKEWMIRADTRVDPVPPTSVLPAGRVPAVANG